MKAQAISCAFFVLGLLICQGRSAEPTGNLLPPVYIQDAGKDQPKQKEKAQEKEKDKIKEKANEKKLTEPPQTNLFAPSASNGFPSYFSPQMMGDWHGIYARQNQIVLGTQTSTVKTTTIVNPYSIPVTTITTNTSTSQIAVTRSVLVPITTRGGFNIAENESPRPQDRVFMAYNFYDNLNVLGSAYNGSSFTQSSTTQVIGRNQIVTTATTTSTTVPGVAQQQVDLHREIIGFEKTFLDGRASIELRAPVLQQSGSPIGLNASNVGDLTVIGKYALVLNPVNGNVFSTGLAITAPTGPSIVTTDGNFRDTLIQPFIGYIWSFDRFFIQGFHSVVIPTDKNDVTLAFNDLGINYWLYRASPDRTLNFIVPTIEAHVATPFNHRNLDGPIVVPDTVIMTGGVHFGLFRNGTLTLGVATPVTGPRPYTIETFAQLNWRY